MVEMPEVQPQITVDYYNTQHQEEAIIKILLNNGNKHFLYETVDENGAKKTEELVIAEFVFNDLINDEIDFIDPLYSKMFEEYKTTYFDPTKDVIKHFTSHPDEAIRSKSINLLTTKYEESPEWENKYNIVTPNVNIENSGSLKNDIISSILALKLRNVDILINIFKAKLNELNYLEEDYTSIFIDIQNLEKIKKILCKRKSIVVSR